MEAYSNWIWTRNWDSGCDRRPVAVLFRKKVYLNGKAKQADVKISADSRYKLFVNGTFVEAGPSKGDGQIWFYDKVSLMPYLRRGENVLAVAALRFPLNPSESNQSMVGSHIPGLFVEGQIVCQGESTDISGNGTWKCRIDERVQFVREAKGFSPLHFYEDVTGDESMRRWMCPGYADAAWEAACPYERSLIRDAVSPGNLNARTIPYMRRNPGRFCEVTAVRKSELSRERWEDLIQGNKTVEIGPNREEIVEFHAGEEMTAYLHLAFEQGQGAVIEIVQAESYVRMDLAEGNGKPVKGDRTDAENGVLLGYQDVFRPAGGGTPEEPEVYEPFWFRTFRFVKLKVVTGDAPLGIRDISFEETGYPLDIQARAETSDDSLGDIWNISARTLKRCMHETYMDCPYYEQLQYVMDSRAQILYTYSVSMDDRLARKCMDDFKRAQRYDGLLCSAYPNTRPNVIPGFSIFYVWMVFDHMMYFGDKDLIRYHMPAVEQVLAFFERNRTKEGYVGRVGGYYRQAKFWSFIDWAPQWKVGVPKAAEKGPLTMESLLYMIGLEKAAELTGFLGRQEQAQEYRKLRSQVEESVKSFCVDENGWVTDGPGVREYSQHCQVFGILAGVLDAETGKRNLMETLRNRERYAQCTVSMAWYLFRALETAGAYAKTERCWDAWRDMVRNHMTTVAESDDDPRSECHAWGALALYELPSVILGVRPGAPGYGKILVKPETGYLRWAKGESVTPWGKVSVKWEKNEKGEKGICVKACDDVMDRIVKEAGIQYVTE